MKEKKLKAVGEVSHYYSKAGVAIVDLKGPLSVGDEVVISGATTNLKQTVNSMQIEHKNVTKAKKGQSVGLKVNNRVRERDLIYKTIE